MINLHNEDSLRMLPTFDDNSVDIIITDPPYDFDRDTMGMYTDEFVRISKYGYIVFCPPENQWTGHKEPDQYLFWVKPISTKNTSKSYSRFVEMILVFGKNKLFHCYYIMMIMF